MVKHEENIFLRGNAEFFLRLQKHFQVNSFKTESRETWTALDNGHELMAAPNQNALFCLQFNCNKTSLHIFLEQNLNLSFC